MEASTLKVHAQALLIVDDEPLMTDLFRQFMTKRGYRVLTASSGPEALAVVQTAQGEVNLVITDMTMPGMDGLEMARRLRELRPDLPVLIATGHDNSETPLPSNVVGIIQKPYQNRVLAERIQQILDQHAPRHTKDDDAS
jgi:CheY-like chemotaxis protein